MISTQLAEELKSKFNPDGSVLRRHQLIMLDMLSKFDAFCKTYHITYWLSSGTTLGAVRHAGFIPWDDDMDVEMLQNDFLKLIKYRKELQEETGLALQDHQSDKEYIAPYAKLRDCDSIIEEIHNNDKNYKYRGIYIDLFVREKGSKFTTFISHGCQYCSYQITRIKNNFFRKTLKTLCYQSMHKIVFPLLGLLDKILLKPKCLRHIKGSGFYASIPAEAVFPLKYILFENQFFPVPGDVDTYLKALYGDYQHLPSIDSIHPHYGKISFHKDEVKYHN